jgi:hypothetical protein
MERKPRYLLLTVLMTVPITACAPHHSVTVLEDEVLLSLREPEAREVQFASSVDRFQPHLARQGASGNWVVSVPTGKEFVYFYRVDGRIMVPECKRTVLDDFGSRNCVHAMER